MAAASPIGPSRHAHLSQPPPAPSTSGDSESTAALPTEKLPEVGLLKELAKSALVEILNDIQGAKTLILDPALTGPLGLVAEVDLLKRQAVDKMLWLEPGPLDVRTRNVVWLCRPKMEYMTTIAEQIQAQQRNPSASGPLMYTILLVPRATELCKKVLEDQGVAGDVTLSEFKLGFIPMEDDLLSLEMEDVSRDLYLNGDDTPIYYSSLALMTFQRAFGLFPRILGKGDRAKKLTELLQRHHTSGPAQFTDLQQSEQVDGLIVFDRSVDWVTPMCTQLTYEGMLDEYVGIKNSHIEVDPALVDPSQAPANASSSTSALPATPVAKKRKQHLSSQKDVLYQDIRDLNFAAVGTKLSRSAKRLEGVKADAKNLKSVSQMKEYVGQLGGFEGERQSLRLHTGLAEQLMAITRTDVFNKNLEVQQNLEAGYDVASQLLTIEDLLYQQAPWQTVLRLAVLMSLTSNGLKPKNLEAFKRDFLQVYGYHHLPLLVALQDLNLLVRSPPPIPQSFPVLRKSLRLIVEGPPENDLLMKDISYVFSGFAPLSVRLVQCVTQKNAIMSAPGDEDGPSGKRILPRAHPIGGWKGFEDSLAGIAGATIDVRQRSEGARRDVISRSDERTLTTVVFFLGGCTYAEIAALRWMSKQTKGRRYLIATTGIINGNTLLESFGDKPPVPLKQQA